MPTTSQVGSQICKYIIASVAALISALAFSSSALAATLTSDQADYAPGSTAYITGSGFAQGETVQCQVLHIPDSGDNNTSPAHLPWPVTADAAGNFQTSWLVPIDQDEIGATLQLTATGQSSDLTAQTTFTDESCGTASISSVVGVGGACVQSTTNGNNQFWDIAAGGTYMITLSGVTECSGASIQVIVHSTALGNYCTTATGGSGTYTFTYPAPPNGCDTENIEYCTSACQ